MSAKIGIPLDDQASEFIKAIADENLPIIHEMLDAGFQLNQELTNLSLSTRSVAGFAIQARRYAALECLVHRGLDVAKLFAADGGEEMNVIDIALLYGDAKSFDICLRAASVSSVDFSEYAAIMNLGKNVEKKAVLENYILSAGLQVGNMGNPARPKARL